MSISRLIGQAALLRGARLAPGRRRAAAPRDISAKHHGITRRLARIRRLCWRRGARPTLGPTAVTILVPTRPALRRHGRLPRAITIPRPLPRPCDASRASAGRGRGSCSIEGHAFIEGWPRPALDPGRLVLVDAGEEAPGRSRGGSAPHAPHRRAPEAARRREHGPARRLRSDPRRRPRGRGPRPPAGHDAVREDDRGSVPDQRVLRGRGVLGRLRPRAAHRARGDDRPARLRRGGAARRPRGPGPRGVRSPALPGDGARGGRGRGERGRARRARPRPDRVARARRLERPPLRHRRARARREPGRPPRRQHQAAPRGAGGGPRAGAGCRGARVRGAAVGGSSRADRGSRGRQGPAP